MLATKSTKTSPTEQKEKPHDLCITRDISLPNKPSDDPSTNQESNTDMALPLPDHIANKLAMQTFDNFDDFSQAFWLAIAEDPIYATRFVTSQLNRIKQGWPPRAPFNETAKGVRNYQLCHLDPPTLGSAMYDAENLRIMSALQYALSSEVQW